MQQFLQPLHKLPDEEQIKEHLINSVKNQYVEIILSNIKLPKKCKPQYWIQQESDKIIFAVKLELENSHLSYLKVQTKDSFKELMRIRNSTGVYDFTYVYQDGMLVARVNSDGSKYFYHPDHLGSTSLITDSNGNVVENSYYSPYGELLGGGTSDVKLYTGQFKDNVLCQYYYGKRYFAPCNAQFIQPDSLIHDAYNPQSLNHYSYVLNNPYKYIDYSGLFAVTISGGGSGSYGATGIEGKSGYVISYDPVFGLKIGSFQNFGGGLASGGGLGGDVGLDIGFAPNVRSIKELEGKAYSYGASGAFGYAASGEVAFPVVNGKVQYSNPLISGRIGIGVEASAQGFETQTIVTPLYMSKEKQPRNLNADKSSETQNKEQEGTSSNRNVDNQHSTNPVVSAITHLGNIIINDLSKLLESILGGK